ncbi:MAG TPA: cyclic nucleotide-binding domain-containing protein, partial [Polyangiaceae bacterium]|nr:cyclic nucleotide-binding domain-containing protein [Polyangiaceae bacterium]
AERMKDEHRGQFAVVTAAASDGTSQPPGGAESRFERTVELETGSHDPTAEETQTLMSRKVRRAELSMMPPALDPTRYVDRGEIGRGGTASVRLVEDQVLWREVAMKVLLSEYEPEHQKMFRFLREARITAFLDHPNIVPVHELGIEAEQQKLFFTMKRVDGRSLSDVIRDVHANQATPEGLYQLLQIFVKVCDAVGFAHSRGIVHRDLKPANIMVGGFGQVYVMDWGAALLLPDCTLPHDRLEAEDENLTIIGTAAYMAPEQAFGDARRIDQRTDVYGLGSILFQILSGRGPHHDTDSRKALSRARLGQIPNLQELTSPWHELPSQLCEIAERALAKQPEDRYANVAELEHAVEQFSLGGGWFRSKTFAPGELIVREGEVGDAAYIITSGECEVYKTALGEKRILGRLGPSDVFGEAAVLTGETRMASVVAVTEVVVRVVTPSSLEHELRQNPVLAAFVKALAARFVSLDQALSRQRGWTHRES